MYLSRMKMFVTTYLAVWRKFDNTHVCFFMSVVEELKATGKFELMDLDVDEAEHSMEMHLPYLAKVFDG